MKIVIVLVLTANGLLIYAMVLPGVLRDVSRPMFEGASNLRVGVFLVSGVSPASRGTPPSRSAF